MELLPARGSWETARQWAVDTLFAPFRAATLLSRRLHVYGLAYYLYSSYTRAGEQAEKISDEHALRAHWDATHERLAGVACWHCAQLLGLWVKFGQFLSTRHDVMPELRPPPGLP